jgi:class 3 adenylate cyclase/tetratricopeptide (TPR) repeat protein
VAIPCSRCRAQVRPDHRFCPQCGAPLPPVCPSCGFVNEPKGRFCGGCGAPLGAAAPAHEARFHSPQAYTPEHLAQQILQSREALEGERKQVTVLFADMKGSMELLGDRDPEEARRILDPVLERMMDAVHRYEGTVNQVMGDGIMALFGAPLAHEDHAVRACYAALRMQEAVREYTEAMRRTHGVEVQIRAGLHSGEVVVRSVGSDLRMDYSAVGQTTHLAARMEQLATPGTVRLTAATLRLAEGLVQATPLGPVPVKGMPEAVEVYELVGAGPGRTRLQASAARGLSRFVGRDGEMAELARAAEQARAGQGQVVAVVGEAGVGKSRLFHEFVRSHRTRGWLVLEAGSVSYGKAAAYRPVIDLLRGYLKIEDRDATRAIRAKVTGSLMALDETLREAVPPILWLLEAVPEDSPFLRLDPVERRLRARDAIRRLLLRECQAQPLVVVFEDLHWIDGESQAFLDALVEGLPTAAMLLGVNYRPQYQHGWGGKTYYRQLRIDPLAPATAEALLEGLLGPDPGVAALHRPLIRRTEGNPLFLEECVRTLAEAGVLDGCPGAYRLAGPFESVEIPATVQAILAARIDRLAAGDKRLLQCAAVVGKDVPLALLQAVADLPDPALRQGLARLQAAEFLYETSLFPEVEYTFKHALTHEVASASLLHERRRALSARIVAAIEGLREGRLTDHVDSLAHHALRGELWEPAIGYLQQAAAKAAGRAAYREAVAFLERALQALGHCAPGPEAAGLGVDLRLALRDALFPLGDHAGVGACLAAARTLALETADTRRLARVLGALTNHALALRDHDTAIEVGEQAAALAAEMGDGPAEALARFHLGQAHASRGDYRRAVACQRRTIALLAGSDERAVPGPSPALGLSRLWLVWGLAELGEFDEAIPLGEEAVAAAAAGRSALDQITTRLGLGLAWLRLGELEQAAATLEQALAESRLAGLPVWQPAIASPLGYAYALAGRTAEAVPLLEQAVREGGAPGRAGHALRVAHLGEAYLLAGQTDAAASAAARALALARENRDRAHEAYAIRLSAETAARDAPDDAEAAYRAAAGLAEELGLRPLLAHCWLGLGCLPGPDEARARAQVALATAVALYREMGMRRWLARAEGTLAAG